MKINRQNNVSVFEAGFDLICLFLSVLLQLFTLFTLPHFIFSLLFINSQRNALASFNGILLSFYLSKSWAPIKKHSSMMCVNDDPKVSQKLSPLSPVGFLPYLSLISLKFWGIPKLFPFDLTAFSKIRVSTSNCSRVILCRDKKTPYE